MLCGTQGRHARRRRATVEERTWQRGRRGAITGEPTFFLFLLAEDSRLAPERMHRIANVSLLSPPLFPCPKFTLCSPFFSIFPCWAFFCLPWRLGLSQFNFPSSHPLDSSMLSLLPALAQLVLLINLVSAAPATPIPASSPSDLSSGSSSSNGSLSVVCTPSQCVVGPNSLSG